MSKRIIGILVVLMGLSIIGVITIQLIWISNAIKLNNQLFQRRVNEALISSVQQLENQRNLTVMSKLFIQPDSLISHFFGQEVPPFFKENFQQLVVPTKPAHTDSIIQRTHKQQIIISENGNHKKISSHIEFNSSTNFDTIKIQNRNLNRIINKRIMGFKNKSKQLMQELFDFRSGREVDPEIIQAVLTRELNSRGIDTPFSYGIVDNQTVSYLSEGTQMTDLEATPFWTLLYPNDFIPKSTRLALIFPNQRSFVLSSINWILLASLSLSCVILIIFTISIFLILKQKKVAQMKSDFINNMTHEFKTPIATINVAANSIINQKVINEPKQITFFAQMIAKENKRMNQQVEKILRIARLEKKDFQLSLESINAHEYIAKVLESFQLQITQSGGTLTHTFNAEQPIITTDITHFENVIANLIDNAIKYSHQAPQVSLTTDNKEKGLLITVTDNGIGMPRSVQNKIFDRFYREASGNVHNVKGFGLGLSYVKAIIEANNGYITVSSEPNKGSSFKLFFPFTL